MENLGEDAYNHLRERLFRNLENEQKCERLRKERHPDDETLFVFTLYIFEGKTRHEFEFHVDDTMADTHLFVLDAVHRAEITE